MASTIARIKDVALRLMVEKGVAETTIRDLAREAGVAEGTLYRHYASKEDMVRDLFREHYAEFARRLERLTKQEVKRSMPSLNRHSTRRRIGVRP